MPTRLVALGVLASAIIEGVERGVTVEVTEVENDEAQWKIHVAG